MNTLPTQRPDKLPSLAVLLLLTGCAMIVTFSLLLFWPAGRIDWLQAWLYIAVVGAYSVISMACMHRWNPVLILRRSRFGKGTKRWDVVWSIVFAPLMVGIYVVAGLEYRSDAAVAAANLDPLRWGLGLLVFVAGAAMFTWSMVVNPFFEKTVRIQHDHDQYVVDTGPYAIVRHPGYVGFLGWLVGTPLLLGSFWAWYPALAAVLAIVVRTWLEDRTLAAELAGYDEYRQRVRYRLLPGVW